MDKDKENQSHFRSTAALINRIDTLTTQLVKRYIDLVVLASPPTIPASTTDPSDLSDPSNPSSNPNARNGDHAATSINNTEGDRNGGAKAKKEEQDEEVGNKIDLQTAATNTVRMRVEMGALIRSTHSLTTLSRALKEKWLFGVLDTFHPSRLPPPPFDGHESASSDGAAGRAGGGIDESQSQSQSHEEGADVNDEEKQIENEIRKEREAVEQLVRRLNALREARQRG